MPSWTDLLTPYRKSDDQLTGRTKEKWQSDDGASVFAHDAGRIIHSSAFRRMQGKTQVHPFPNSDYLRTRLTHTIEVAQVGRQIAQSIERYLIAERELDPDRAGSFSDIVYAAALAHDIGNPPFGHIGEYAIQTWVQRQVAEEVIEKEVAESQDIQGLKIFDGNAQGFRIISSLSGWRGRGGLRLTYPVLGAFSKYPYSATHAGGKPKFGYHHCDRRHAAEVYNTLKMPAIEEGKWARHPLAYIVEAADDICYLATDIEDAYKAGVLNLSTAEALLSDCSAGLTYSETLAKIPKNSSQDRLSYLRSAAIVNMSREAASTFQRCIDLIKNGNLSGSLLANSGLASAADEIRAECQKTVYRDEDKMQTETAGYHTILNLLDLFGFVSLSYGDSGYEGLDELQKNIFALLPAESATELKLNAKAENLQIAIDYVSGMTDKYALEFSQKLSGVSMSLGRMK